MNSKVSYDILNVLASLGGLSKLITMIFRFLGKEINKKIVLAKYIRGLYFIENYNASRINSSSKHIHNIKTIRMKAFNFNCFKK